MYFPDEGGAGVEDHEFSVFSPPDGVELYGGFAGHETALAQRAFAAPSILSGDLGQDDPNEDGSYELNGVPLENSAVFAAHPDYAGTAVLEMMMREQASGGVLFDAGHC